MSASKKTPSKQINSVSKQKNSIAKTPTKSTNKKQLQKQSSSKHLQSGSIKKDKKIINDIKQNFLSSFSSTEQNENILTELIDILGNEQSEQANLQFHQLVQKSKVNQKVLLEKIIRKLNSKQINGLVYLINQYLHKKKQNSQQANINLSLWIHALNTVNGEIIFTNNQIQLFIEQTSRKSKNTSQLISNLNGKMSLLIGF